MKKISYLISFFLLLFSLSAEASISLKGSLIVNELGYKANFELIKDKESLYFLRVKPKTSTKFCDFYVKRISSPQQIRGVDGLILSSKIKKCNFLLPSKGEVTFWNKIKLIDLNYRLTESLLIDGEVSLNSVHKSFRAIIHTK